MSTRDFSPTRAMLGNPPRRLQPHALHCLQNSLTHNTFWAFFPTAECKRRWQPAMMCRAVESQDGIVRCVLHIAVTGLDLLTLFPHCPKPAFPFPIALPYTEHPPKTPFFCTNFSPQCSWFPFLSCTISFLKSSFSTLSSKDKTIRRKTKSTLQSSSFLNVFK